MQKKYIFGVISVIILLILTLAALFAPIWVSKSPLEIDTINRLNPPSIKYWFGTDEFGRDLFSRVIYAGRTSLLIGFGVAIFTTILGIITGLISGYYKRVDSIIMRFIDGIMSIPAILLALALVSALGGNKLNITIALTVAFWPVMTRVVRSSTLQISKVQFIEAAKSTGVNDFVILFRYILPNAMAPIIVQGTFIFAKAILIEAALSFLGVGIHPPTPTWGNILGDARIYLTAAPWFSIFPGVAIMITVLSLNMFGENIRDLMDPYSVKRRKKKLNKSLVNQK